MPSERYTWNVHRRLTICFYSLWERKRLSRTYRREFVLGIAYNATNFGEPKGFGITTIKILCWGIDFVRTGE